MSLTQFWPSQSAINDCIQPEAEVPRFEVLLAAHRPMRFALAQGNQRRQVDEHEMLARFLDPHVQRGTALLKISGSSGVGKSHVIRWLDAQLRAREDSSSRHIIRLPKSTSLKGAINRILEGLVGPNYDQLRGRLMIARDHLDSDDAAIVLTANLQIAIKRQVQRARDAIAAAVRRGERGLDRDRLWTTHESLLDVLTDPGLRHRWIGGAKALGVLAHVANRVLKEGLITDGETTLQFKENDLTFSQEEISELSLRARNYIHLLNTSQGKHKRDAVGLLNSVIDDAANQLLQLGDTGLTDIFDELRKALLKDGKELIVLIEDFAVLSGMQGALLGALVNEAIVEGRQVRCTMRTALAVTSGYELPDTAKTRATGEYFIEDSPFEDDDAAVDAIVDLVGRYLNAARLGSSKLEKAYRTRAPDQGSWVPRFEDGLSLSDEDESTLVAFGPNSDSERFSLFPFNRAALSQLSKLRFRRASQGEERIEFNPRKVLQLIRETLVNCREDFEQGQFPPSHFGNADGANRVNSEVEAAIKQRENDPLKRRRLEALVKFWGDDPKSSRPEDWSLSPKILRTFGFKDIGTSASPRLPTDGSKTTTPGTGTKPIETTPPGSDSKLTGFKGDVATTKGGSATDTKGNLDKVEAPGTGGTGKPPAKPILSTEFEKWGPKIEAWRAGRSDFLQEDATQLRQWIADDVLSSINWDAEFLPTPKGDFPKEFRKYVFIPKAGTPGNATEVNYSVRVATVRDLGDRDAALDLSLTMLALIRWKLEGSWSFDLEGTAYARWASFVESQREHALKFYRSQLNEPILAPAARALYIGTRMLNISGSHTTTAKSMMEALFTELPPPVATRPAAAQSGVGWEGLRSTAAEQRKKLQEFVLRFIGARQGGEDKVYAIDFSRLSTALGDVQTTLTIGGEKAPSTDDPDIKQAVEHIRQLRNHFSKALEDYGASLTKRLVRCASDLGDAPDKRLLKTDVDEVCRLSLTSLSLQLDYSEKLRRSCEQVIALPLESLKPPATTSNPNTALTHLSAVDDVALKAAENFLGEFDRFASAVEARLRAGGLVASAELLRAEEEEINNELALIAKLAEIPSALDQPALLAKNKAAAKSTREKTPPPQAGSVDASEVKTGMVLIRCEKLKKALKDYGALQQIKDKAQTLREHREKVKSKREDLNSAKLPWQLLKSHGVKGLKNPRCPASLTSGVPELLRRLKESQPLNSGQDMARCLEGAALLAKAYEDAATEAWKAYRESNLYPGVSVELVQTFQAVKGFESKAFELEKSIVALDENCQRYPQSEPDWIRCHEAHKKCTQLHSKLPLENLPEQVEDFLKATAAGGASLSSLTKEVLDWLRKHGLERSFVIRAASSVSPSERFL